MGGDIGMEDGPPLGDGAEELLEGMPELKEGESFIFACGPDTPCFNRCCAELVLPLTPYDVLRLRRRLGMDGEAFLTLHARMRSFPDTGLPLPLLRMLDGPGEICPFVTPAGCAVYEDRPGACRCYPLGRGARMARGGVEERFFVVREQHCHGFDAGRSWTAKEWLEDQGLAPFNEANDRYMRLMAMVRAAGRPLDRRMGGMALLCLYQLDRFRDLAERMRLFSRVEIGAERRERVMAEDEAALDFAFDWLELAIFGECERLGRR